MEIEEKSPVTVPEEGNTLRNNEEKEDSSSSEAWSSSVKDSKWATAEPTKGENPYERSNGSSSQSRWAASEGSRYRPQHNDKSFGGYSHTDRNRREHSIHSRPYNNRSGYGGSPDGPTESYRSSNNHNLGNRSNHNMENSRFTGNAGMRFDSNTNQNYQNRAHNNTFREADSAWRSNSRYDDRNHNNRNDRSYGHQNHQHEGYERHNNRPNYHSDRNNQHHGRQPNDAISKWHSGNLIEEEPRSSAHERPWNMRFVTGDQQNTSKYDDRNDGKDKHEQKKSAENTADSETLAGNTQPTQESNNLDERREDVDNENHNEKIQTDTANDQPASSAPKTTEEPEIAVAAGVETVKESSSLGSIHAVSQEAEHDNKQLDVNQYEGDAVKAEESTSKDSTASIHSAEAEKAAENGGHVSEWQKHATENNGAVGFSSDSIHAHQERRQPRSTERKQSGASASTGKTSSIASRLATGGYHKPSLDEDALNAKIERIRLQNEKIERKQKLIEQEELEIAHQMKLENAKLEQERRENEELEKERRLAEEQQQREKQEKEKRILDQIRAERDANASRKAEAMGNRDWDMSKGENDDGYRDRHSRSKFSHDAGKRWPSPPPRSRNDHGYDHGSGHHSQGYRRHDMHNNHQEPIKKQFSVTEQNWPDLGNVKGDSASAERKPAVWAARTALQAKGQNTTAQAGQSFSSPPNTSQSTGDSHKSVSWPSKKGPESTETTSSQQDAADAKPAPPKLNWEDLISKTTPVKDWASDSPNNDDMDFGSSPFG